MADKWYSRDLVDVEVIAALPVRVWGERYGTPEYWSKLEKELNYEIRNFNDFLRDHRSQDAIDLTVRRKYEIHCIHCGATYSVDDADGLYPSCCEKAMAEVGVQEKE